MTALAIDTLKLARRLRDTAGFTPEHAEAAAEAFADAVAGTALVTKDHLDVKLAELKAELVEVDHHLEAKIGNVLVAVAESKTDILRWVFAAVVGQTALIVTLLKVWH